MTRHFGQYLGSTVCAASLAAAVVVSAEDAKQGGQTAEPKKGTYPERCGACHAPYLPVLLPSQSWSTIVTNIKNHHGKAVDLDAKAGKEILDHLTANAADKSASRISARIMKSLKGSTPTRITEIPTIKDKHRKIPESTIKRKEIGSLANCVACHTTAEKGVFNEDNVRIPGKSKKSDKPQR